jgi:putative glutamine amidotransferase
MTKTIIGINCDLSIEGGRPRVFLNLDYCDAVERAGGIPVLLPPIGEAKDIEMLLNRLDGLVLSGGDDVPPERYGQQRHERTVPVAKEKDAFDFVLVEMAMEIDLPILGICYGAQLINVALGGSLTQDIESRDRPLGLSDLDRSLDLSLQTLPYKNLSPLDHKSKSFHKVIVEKGTRLHEFLGADVVMVNSSHHQAIDRPGQGLKVSARAEDRTVEAIESTTHSLIIGVQWHPERMLEEPIHRGLFKAFIEETKGRVSKKS